MKFVICLMQAFVLCIHCLPLQSADIEFGHYQISIPGDFSLSKSKTNGMDFEIYDLIGPKRTKVACIFMGNCPQFIFSKTQHTKAPLQNNIMLSYNKVNPAHSDYLLECETVTMDRSFSAWQRIHVFGITKDNPMAELIFSAFRDIKIIKPNL